MIASGFSFAPCCRNRPLSHRRHICGVYYLFDGACVIYVGASRNIVRRINEHRKTGLDFAGYFIDECSPDQLDFLEAQAIAEFKPQFNAKANLAASGAQQRTPAYPWATSIDLGPGPRPGRKKKIAADRDRWPDR